MKRKAKTLTNAQQAAKIAGEALIAKWESMPKFARQEHRPNERVISPVVAQGSVIRDDGNVRVKSRNTTSGVGAKREDKVYTGDAVLGVALMHKSNYAPVFRDNAEAAIEIAQMRR